MVPESAVLPESASAEATSAQIAARPRVSVSKITFSDGAGFDVDADEIVVVVGPNNSGKSEFLRNLLAQLSSKKKSPTPTLQDIEYTCLNDFDSLTKYIFSNFKSTPRSDSLPLYNIYGSQQDESTMKVHWDNRLTSGLASLTQLFVCLLDCETRLGILLQNTGYSRSTESPQTPIQFLYEKRTLETEISALLKEAFDSGLVVNRLGSQIIPLHIGEIIKAANEDSADESYQSRLEKLPLADRQGDGLRSFLGILLHVIDPHRSIFLIDEPEAFLHPPQAREIGKALAGNLTKGKQVFISTHSNEVLKGLVDAGSKRLKVFRITRGIDDKTVPNVLDAKKISELWSTPQLRYSNIYDGLFHELTIVTENERDNKFFNAIIDNLKLPQKTPDLFFTDGAGKGGIAAIAAPLKALQVKLRIVVDIDTLSVEGDMRNLVEALQGTWNDFKSNWDIVSSGIASIPPAVPTIAEIKTAIDALYPSDLTSSFPPDLAKRIKEAAKYPTTWKIIKANGISYLNTAFASNTAQLDALTNLIADLRELGLFIVPVGELEGFYPAVEGKKNWLNKVLALPDFGTRPDLEDARNFCRDLLS